MQRLLLIALALIFTYGCGDKEERKRKREAKKFKQEQHTFPISKDLDQIIADGKLSVITTYSPTSYFLYKGHTMGFEYELLQSFADYLGVELEIIVSNDINNLFNNLNSGKADLVAHGLAITNHRKDEVDFTDYLYLTHQVLVQKKPDNWRKLKWSSVESSLHHDAIDLIGDTVSVRHNTSYYERLINLSDEMGGSIIIDTLEGTTTTAEAIEMVINGEIKQTIADDNIANMYATYYPILNIEVPISFSQRIAWATRHSSPQLQEAVNTWLAQIKKEVLYYIIYNKYFKNNKDFRKRTKSEFFSLNSHKISTYDDLLKKRSKYIGWDWRLLASLVYQESRFDPKAKSWAGAAGLMQIMPATAKELGVKNRRNPVQSINGGTKYLKMLEGYYDSIPDPTQRQKFTMAAYNCGHGHVLDAMALAKKYELNPLVWDDHVEKMILALRLPQNYNDPIVNYGYLRGVEPYTYVQQIFERYDHYKQFIKK